MMLGPIVLTDEEQALWELIPFTTSWPAGRPLITQESQEAAQDLTLSLLGRKAIPQARIRYFTDPELNVGSGRSRYEVFEKNGTRGDEIFSHPAFFKYLRYFVLGPDLPTDTITRFREAVAECGPVTSGDAEGLEGKARSEVRGSGLERKAAAEEFFKLALELDLEAWMARGIRDAVMRLRVR
jgi:hypothetical protein